MYVGFFPAFLKNVQLPLESILGTVCRLIYNYNAVVCSKIERSSRKKKIILLSKRTSRSRFSLQQRRRILKDNVGLLLFFSESSLAQNDNNTVSKMEMNQIQCTYLYDKEKCCYTNMCILFCQLTQVTLLRNLFFGYLRKSSSFSDFPAKTGLKKMAALIGSVRSMTQHFLI
jgi:hypothetical protein